MVLELKRQVAWFIAETKEELIAIGLAITRQSGI